MLMLHYVEVGYGMFTQIKLNITQAITNKERLYKTCFLIIKW